MATQIAVVNAKFVISAPQENQLGIIERFEIALIGRSNVGKSSLLNYLMNRKGLVKTSRTPGRTRLINRFDGDLLGLEEHGLPITFLDLPGYGYAKMSKEEEARTSKLLSNFFKNRSSLGLVIQLVDARHGPTKLDLENSKWLSTFSVPCWVVATKIDQLPKSKRKPAQKNIAEKLGLEPKQVFLVSSTEKSGREELLSAIKDRVERQSK